MKRIGFIINTLLLIILVPLFCFSQGDNMSDPIVMGTYSIGTYSYSDSRNNSSYTDNIGNPSPDIYYKFTVSGPTSIHVSTCGSGWNTFLFLLDGSGNWLIYDYGYRPICAPGEASIAVPSYQTSLQYLPAGTYYIVAEGQGSATGIIKLSVLLTVDDQVPRNLIRSWTATAPESDANNLMAKSLRDVKLSTTYFDGLGRTEQTVLKQGSLNSQTNTSADVVTPFEYDDYGREVKKYLPYVASTSGGQFENNALADQLSFNQTFYSSQNENTFYAQTDYEPSPLDRVTKQMAQGASWAGSGRGVSNKYWFNTGNDDVKMWRAQEVQIARSSTYNLKVTISDLGNGQQSAEYTWGALPSSAGTVAIMYRTPGGSWSGNYGGTTSPRTYTMPTGDYEYGIQIYFGDGTPTQTVVADPTTPSTDFTLNGSYPAGELYKMVTEDENGKQVIEFKDKEGNLILKKVQLLDASYDSGLGSNYSGWLCTYYLYDDYNLLRCVIQPKGVEALVSNGWDIHYNNDVLLNEQCFLYDYDSRSRLLAKKVPGAGWEAMVYDTYDRLVMTQDANLKNEGKWLVTEYDALNRPWRTGLLTDGNTASYHQNLASHQSSSYPNISSNYEVLTQTHYDDYTNLPSGLYSTLYNSGYGTYLTASTSSPDYAEPLAQSTATTGLVTWTTTKVLGTSNQYLSTVNIYDEKGRVIQTQSINQTGGVDVVTNQYNFSGQVLNSHIKHQNLNGASQTYEVATKNAFDDIGRITSVQKNVNGNGWKQISSLSYDALGQLKSKTLGNSLETLNYDYNIRSWLLGVNKNDLASNGSGSSKFAFELGYDKLTNTSGRNFSSVPQYNGNIAGMIWKSAGDGVRRKYDFSYDGANRFIQGSFEQNNSDDDTWNNNEINYTVKMGDGINPTSAYDANGNIKAMTQFGWKLGSSSATPIDNLTYSYQINGVGDDLRNKLYKVTDAINSADSKLGDFKDGVNEGDDYDYDDNGNLVLDNNKSIASITYNHLNLPNVISVTNKGTITYVYDAGSDKLQKLTYDQTTSGKTVTTTTTYIGPFIYESRQTSPAEPDDYTDRLQFISMEEGRIRPVRDVNNNITSFSYDYFLKDHLGNVRIVLTDETKIDPYETLSFEDQNINEQNALWDNRLGQSIDVANVRTSVAMNTGQTNAMLVKRSTGSIGATKLLKVMAGDRIHTSVDYYYTSADASSTNGGTTALSSIVNSLVSALTNSSATSSLIHGGESTINSQLNSNSDLNTAVNAAANTNPSNTAQQAPKAYLCVLFFDERFQFDKDHSVVVPVGYAPNQRVTIDKRFSNAITVPKNGYAYVYFTNESDEMVYFDNFYLSHERGPIQEETHYYPFGLTMAGISSKAMEFGQPENKKKFVGQEFDDDLGWDTYQFKFRIQDPQIGRFLQVDPLSSKYVYNSTYAYAENRVINGIDLEGLEWWATIVTLENNSVISRGPLVENAVKTATEAGDKVGDLSEEQQHHAIPKQLKNDPVMQAARRGGFEFEGKENKIGVDKFDKATGTGRHGNHPKYNAEVARRVGAFARDNPDFSDGDAAEFARNTANNLKETIKNNPNTKINDLFKASAPLPTDNTGKRPIRVLDLQSLKEKAYETKIKALTKAGLML